MKASFGCTKCEFNASYIYKLSYYYGNRIIGELNIFKGMQLSQHYKSSEVISTRTNSSPLLFL